MKQSHTADFPSAADDHRPCGAARKGAAEFSGQRYTSQQPHTGFSNPHSALRNPQLNDGNLVIQERWFHPQLPTLNPQLVTYTRGLDLSGTSEGAGGIGGLLARSESPASSLQPAASPAFYHADGNGNITCLINTNQAIVARYLYDPYGNILSQSGPLAQANLYRFSSKEYHERSRLLYYLYRFYAPGAHKWMGRDLIGERSDLNLLRPLANNLIDHYDVDGRIWYPATPAQNRRVDPTDAGHIWCQNGRPVPQVPRESEAILDAMDAAHGGPGTFRGQYYCYLKCVQRHEQSHADDAIAENPNVCQGVRDGTFLLNNNPTDLYRSELKAHAISKRCLENCKKTCPGTTVDQGLEIENKWAEENVFE